MGKTIEIKFDKLYRYPRVAEYAYVGIPVKEGTLGGVDKVAVLQDGKAVPLQAKVTSRHKDGSVRFMFLRFLADLPANKGTTLLCDYESELKNDYNGITISKEGQKIVVKTDVSEFAVANGSDSIFDYFVCEGMKYEKAQFVGPFLKDGDGNSYEVKIDSWEVEEEGPVYAALTAKGSNIGAKKIDFEIRLNVFAGKPWVELEYRIINSTLETLHIAELEFEVLRQPGVRVSKELCDLNFDEECDSTGCGDGVIDNTDTVGPIYHARGITDLGLMEERTPVDKIRTMVGSSNYKTDFYIATDGCAVNRVVDAKYLIKEANEHFAEVFYGTFFADCTDDKGGVCGTIFQAQQNFPKAVVADKNGICIMLVPENVDKIVMQPGMARTQKLLLHFHKPTESILEIDNRSLIYQMPDRAIISPEVNRESGVYLDVYADKLNTKVERGLIAKADSHGRSYGMLNFGDTPDMGYTEQGRGNGELVWSNNEYDYPHACALIYARTGIRRFMDYVIANCSHWMDVDVCHYSDNPLYVNGQWEHTNGHCKNGKMVCSHQWVEGLFDYYHLTGDKRGYDTAIGIGENILRLLDTPMYANVGEANARETGWALRTLVALYIETRQEKWLVKCEWILDSFKRWEEQYGNWLAPYSDNTVIRVGFMISVALGSIMRYYREFPSDDLKAMMIRAVDDLIENCFMEENGLFYYKELPSINRLGNNTLLLEALVIAYELTGDAKYLTYGVDTFEYSMDLTSLGAIGKKQHREDAVLVGGMSTKNFAQSFIPLATYYKYASKEGLI